MNIKLKILNISTIEKIDSQKIFKIYDNWPRIAEESFNSNTKKTIIIDIKNRKKYFNSIFFKSTNFF